MMLTLAIPVRNDLKGLSQLLTRIDMSGWAGPVIDQVLICDDASDPGKDPEAALPPKGTDLRNRVRLIRLPEHGGPGQARNRLLEETETSHLLYFDSDDILGHEFSGLIHDLRDTKFDFCLFKHVDSRQAEAGILGQTDHDEAIWREAGCAFGRKFRPTPLKAATLARSANFPWNKIYRTDFLRQNNVRCSEILLHEDVELHWMSFLAAHDVLTSDRLGAIHYVASGAARMTNRTGPERLDVFPVLTRIAGEIRQRNMPLFEEPFFRFSSGLFDWIRANLHVAHHAALDLRVRTFTREALWPACRTRLQDTAPDLASRLETLSRAGHRP